MAQLTWELKINVHVDAIYLFRIIDGMSIEHIILSVSNIPDTFWGDEMNSSQLERRQESGRVELM